MNVLRRIIPFITFFTIVIGLWFLRSNPDSFWILSAVLFCSIAILVAIFVSVRGKPVLQRLLFALTAFLIFSVGFGFFIFLERAITQYFCLLIVATIVGVYLENCYRYLYNVPGYSESSLKNVSLYVILMMVFFGSVVFFDIRFYLTYPVWAVVVSHSLLVWFGVQYLGRMHDVKGKMLGLYSTALAVFSAELSLVLTFWPHTPLIKGVVVTATVYAMIQVLIMLFTASISQRKVLQVLGLSSLVLMVSLLTSQWV